MTRRKLGVLLAGFVAVSALAATTAFAGDNDSGFQTSQDPMLTAVMPGVGITSILTVGDVLPNGYRFEAIPDGISVRTRGQGRADLFVNHETSKVPFPFTRANATAANGENDFDNAQVSQLILNQHSVGRSQRLVPHPEQCRLPAFCSNYLATAKEGFDRDIFFTNEESPDYVLRQEDSWPPALEQHPAQEENGVVVATRRQAPANTRRSSAWADSTTRTTSHSRGTAIRWCSPVTTHSRAARRRCDLPSGCHVHPRSRSSTRTSRPAQTPSSATTGDLWAFVSDNLDFDDYYDFTPGSSQVVSGHFIQVPKVIATGRKPDGTEVKAADLGYPLPPTNGSWQTRPAIVDRPAGHRRASVGPRVLERHQQRVPVRPRRGHRLRQAPGNGQRRLRRRLGSGTGAEPRRPARPRTVASGRWSSIQAIPRR